MTRIRLSSLPILATLLLASLAQADGPALLRVEKKVAAR